MPSRAVTRKQNDRASLGEEDGLSVVLGLAFDREQNVRKGNSDCNIESSASPFAR